MNLLQKALKKYKQDMEQEQINKQARSWAYRLQNSEVIFDFINNTIMYGNVTATLVPAVLHALDALIGTKIDF